MAKPVHGQNSSIYNSVRTQSCLFFGITIKGIPCDQTFRGIRPRKGLETDLFSIRGSRNGRYIRSQVICC